MNAAAAASTPGRWSASRRIPWLAAAGVLFVLVVAGRAVLVSLFAESIPYWDQWDSEGAFLLKPWVEGSWEWTRLFDPHNEHRIAFTRLIALGLFEANDGQWDNLVSAYFNVLVYAGTWVLAFVLLAPGLATGLAKAGLFVLMLALAWLPYGVENTLVGFQNQFYLMGAFALLALSMAAHGRDDRWLAVKLAAVAVPGLFTMASGLLGALAAVPVLLARAHLGTLRWRTASIAAATLVAIAVTGYLMVPHVPGHDPLKATDAAGWLAAFGRSLAWPLSKSYKGFWAMWLPTAVALWIFVRERRATPQQLLALGLSGWVLLQCAAIGYSRGGEMALVSGRYLDMLALGIVANGWLALQLAGRLRFSHGNRVAGLLPAVPLALLALALTLSFIRHFPEDVFRADHRWRMSIEQTINVRKYLRSGDRVHLEKPHLHIPYPHAQRLATLLDDETLRGILPASVREPLPIAAVAAVGDFHVVERPTGVMLSSCARQGACATGVGEWRSPPLADRLPYLQVVTGVVGAARNVSLEWSRDGNRTWTPLRLEADATLRLFVPATGGALHARDASASSSLRLQPPAGAGRLSMIAARLQDAVRRRVGAGFSPPPIWRQDVAPPTGGPEAQALAIAPGTQVRLAWQAPHPGRITTVSFLLGNYFDHADGMMEVEICAGDDCARGDRPLRESRDNEDFRLPVRPALAVAAGMPLSIRITTRDATHPVALWTFPPAPGSVRIDALPPEAEEGLRERTPRLVLRFDD